jgi:hypothetical protein
MLEKLRLSVDPEVHVGQKSTLAGRAEMCCQRERLLAGILEFAGVVAVLLSAIGIYGLVSNEVVRRTREIGILVALGADTTEVIGRVIRRGLDGESRSRRWRVHRMVLRTDADHISTACSPPPSCPTALGVHAEAGALRRRVHHDELQRD